MQTGRPRAACFNFRARILSNGDQFIIGHIHGCAQPGLHFLQGWQNGLDFWGSIPLGKPVKAFFQGDNARAFYDLVAEVDQFFFQGLGAVSGSWMAKSM